MPFQKNEKLFYDRVGVCRVDDIGNPGLTGMPKDRDYYTLQPLYQNGTILLPVDSPAYLRRLMNRQEAETLLSELPQVELVETGRLDARGVAALYQLPEPLDSCRVLAGIARSVWTRGQQRARAGRRPSASDLRFRKFAESLLLGELAEVLEIPLQELEAHIAGRLETAAGNS